MTKDDYVSIEVAKMLKEKGFNEICPACYRNEKFMGIVSWNEADMFGGDFYSAPTLYDAQKWLREKHQLHVDVGMSSDYSTDADGIKCDEWFFWCFGLYYTTSLQHLCDCEVEFDTYEEALNAGILESLNYI